MLACIRARVLWGIRKLAPPYPYGDGVSPGLGRCSAKGYGRGRLPYVLDHQSTQVAALLPAGSAR